MQHQKYILRCLQLAKLGVGTTRPNPSVGAVIVLNDRIIGEGYTSPFGGPHAEVNAINAVTDKSLLREATLYVTLEPCSHYGKTPPCVDLIILHKIPKIVIGTLDPHDKVAGKGVKKLKEAGCEVIVGVLEDACKLHHKRFLTFHTKKRPYIILKWAQSIDGFIAPNDKISSIHHSADTKRSVAERSPIWITNQYSRQLVHKWRSQEHAILVGTNTVLQDNPSLSTRDWDGTSPIRIVLDRKRRISDDYAIYDGKVKTIILTQIKDKQAEQRENVLFEKIDFSKNIAANICKVLSEHNIQSLIVEGGTKTLQTFIDEKLWDEASVFTGPLAFENGVKAPILDAAPYFEEKIAEDTLKTYFNR
ncbi:bifunctional diaminohydroxyphosphoribosylaminopyrimidine deaminase/5-amino-6-(5-phosphoribosylamino)uracil reductase RibD [Sungkyunkwania multivorans]|uniref:Riboflavin biosynthesis protein RibD n=1 Tax=Sungkyunkwania multivorans TaxID=1173618 RepID=A0ABW3CXF6_9FLAO